MHSISMKIISAIATARGHEKHRELPTSIDDQEFLLTFLAEAGVIGRSETNPDICEINHVLLHNNTCGAALLMQC